MPARFGWCDRGMHELGCTWGGVECDAGPHLLDVGWINAVAIEKATRRIGTIDLKAEFLLLVTPSDRRRGTLPRHRAAHG